MFGFIVLHFRDFGEHIDDLTQRSNFDHEIVFSRVFIDVNYSADLSEIKRNSIEMMVKTKKEGSDLLNIYFSMCFLLQPKLQYNTEQTTSPHSTHVDFPLCCSSSTIFPFKFLISSFAVFSSDC